ncbi:MAG: nucleoside hydrolase [Eubacteriales bacterium]|nr:nucleoside hydrolase [Eubacteriales bacterium]
MRELNYKFQVPDQKKVRVIVHTDCKNEADDQFALVHHLLTPKFLIKGIIGGHFNRTPKRWGAGCTAQASMEEIKKILYLMDMEGICPVQKGSEYGLSDEQTPRDSDGVRLLIEEAMKDDPHPLYVVCQGAVTDLASAILLKPEICSRMTAVWIGGGVYPKGGWEFNTFQDIAAVNVVMESQMPFWQIPANVYEQMDVTFAELQERVQPCGAIGDYLFRQLTEFSAANPENPWPSGESWCLGDSPGVSVLLERESKTGIYEEIDAPRVDPEDMTYTFGKRNRKIRVYNQVNVRLTLEDFYAKLALNFRDK